MTVSTETPVISYTANGVTTVFAYPFRIIETDDMQVSINGADSTISYEISGVGDSSGGDVTFTTAPANGAIVKFYRNPVLERTTDYQNNGDFLSSVVNADFDRLWMALISQGYLLGNGDPATSRALMLGENDVNGSGAYQANENRIVNLADPVDAQDATTKKYVDAGDAAVLAATKNYADSATASAAAAATSATEAQTADSDAQRIAASFGDLDSARTEWETAVSESAASQVAAAASATVAQDASTDAAQYSSAVRYATYAAMVADTTQATGARGWVWGDADLTERGFYDWTGSAWVYANPQPASESMLLATQLKAYEADAGIDYLKTQDSTYVKIYGDEYALAAGFSADSGTGGAAASFELTQTTWVDKVTFGLKSINTPAKVLVEVWARPTSSTYVAKPSGPGDSQLLTSTIDVSALTFSAATPVAVDIPIDLVLDAGYWYIVMVRAQDSSGNYVSLAAQANAASDQTLPQAIRGWFYNATNAGWQQIITQAYSVQIDAYQGVPTFYGARVSALETDLGVGDHVLASDSLNASTLSTAAIWPASAFSGWAITRQFTEAEHVDILRCLFNNTVGTPVNNVLDASYVTVQIYRLTTAPTAYFETLGTLVKSMNVNVTLVSGGSTIDLPVDIDVEAGLYYVFAIRAWNASGVGAGIGSAQAVVPTGTPAALDGFYKTGSADSTPNWAVLTNPTKIYAQTINTGAYVTEAKIQQIEADVAALKESPATAPTSALSLAPNGDPSISGLSVTLPEFAVTMSGASITVPATAVTLDEPASTSVSGYAYTLLYSTGQSAATNTNALLPDRYLSGLVVTRTSDSAVLVAGTDYNVMTGQGKITGIKSSATSTPVTLSYTGVGTRYDLIVLDPISGAISVIKGADRRFDAEAYIPAVTASGLIPLYSAWIVGTTVKLVPMYEWLPGMLTRVGTEAEQARWWQHNCKCTARVRKKLEAGEPINLVGYGDSITGTQVTVTDWATPNGVGRDTQLFLQFMPADTKALLPKFDHGDGAGQVHIHIGWNWYLKAALEERYGSTITYNNFGVAGTTSENYDSGSFNTGGLYPARLAAMLATNPDLVVVAFGQNERGADDTGTNVASIVAQCQAAGADCIIVGCPRINDISLSTGEAGWSETNQRLAMAALFSGAAYCSTQYIEDDDGLGFSGLNPDSLCAMNLYNHPSPTQLKAIGTQLAGIFLG